MKISILDIVLIVFSSYGITYMIRYTYGPGDVFLKFRIWMGMRYKPLLDETGMHPAGWIEEDWHEDSWHAKLVQCFWCLNTWVSLALVLLFPKLPIWIYVWFAIVGIAGFLHDRCEDG